MKITFSPLGTITTRFGDIDRSHPKPHVGVDYACPSGTPIHSPVEGIVTDVVERARLGKGIFIKTDDGYQFIFGHLSEFKVRVGEHISKGEIIGLSGNTGHSTGPHLHFAVKDTEGHFIDPYSLAEKTTEAFAVVGWKDGAINLFGAIVENAVLV